MTRAPRAVSRSLLFVGILATVLTAAGCAREDPPPLRLSVDTSRALTQDVARVLDETPRLDTLAAHLRRNGLLDDLRGEGPFTVFAPSDEAFTAVPARIDSLLRAADDSSRAVLIHHLARGLYDSLRVANDTLQVSTLAHRPVRLYRASPGAPLHVGAAPVRRSIRTGNGVIHIVDDVLTPPRPDSL